MKGKGKKRLTFGLIINRVNDWEDSVYYQSRILSGVREFTHDNDINLICFLTGRLDSPNEWERKKNILFNLVNKKHIDGLIILGTSICMDFETEEFRELMEKYGAIPKVFLNSSPEDYPYVGVDNRASMRRIVDHMIEVHECRKVAFIKGPEKNYEAQERFQAYLDSLSRHGIPYDPDLVYTNQEEFNFSSGAKAVSYFVDEKKVRFDSIVASNDNIAAGALTELYKRSGEVPENIPVTGFDDSEISRIYSLTTVRQNFFEQAKLAANMLLKIINSDRATWNIEAPCELIIRSSCGCEQDSLLEYAAVKYDLTGKNFDAAFRKRKHGMLAELYELNRLVGSGYVNELFDLEKKMLSVLHDDIGSSLNRGLFNVLNNIIFWMISKNINILILQDVLSIFRRYLIPCLSDLNEISNLETVFHTLRIHVIDAARKLETSNKIMSHFETDEMNVLGEKLISAPDFMSQMDILYSELPKYGVKSCCIALYENPDNPLASSKLVLAYNERARLDIKDGGIRYATGDFLPDEVISVLGDFRFSAVVLALHDGDTQLGYVLFDCDSRIGNSLEYIRGRLSFALKNALLIDEIRKQAQNLEEQVKERTKELSRTNRKLKKEIEMRKDFEIRLKKALDDLELYNRKLYDQSIRDELTGLYNRRGFMELGNRYCQNAKAQGEGFWIAFADLDGLKNINDIFGHNEGDSAIKTAARLIEGSFREMDIVARLGGDEFIVIVTDILPENSDAIRKRLLRAFEDYNAITQKPYDLSISVGAAYFDPGEPVSFDELLSKADKSLYNHKQRHKMISGIKG